jgi:5-methylthioadenosine/S-adenosylhomocysteine deaminase
MALHAEYSSAGGIARQLAEYAKKAGAGVQVHLSETEAEHEECKGRRGGLTPAGYLNEAGFFDVRATAAHCVWLSAGDMDILAEKNVTAASCPVSNMKLASGVCDVPALLRKGINVAIGTDGAASNNSLNFLEEMKFFALANKARRGDPTLITPAETVAAATFAGANAQGRTDSGSISVGNKADLIVIDLRAPNMRPIHDLLNNIVYSASGGDVLLTMADGRILFENGEYTTIDIEKTIFNVGRSVDRILGKISPRPSDAKTER